MLNLKITVKLDLEQVPSSCCASGLLLVSVSCANFVLAPCSRAAEPDPGTWNQCPFLGVQVPAPPATQNSSQM